MALPTPRHDRQVEPLQSALRRSGVGRSARSVARLRGRGDCRRWYTRVSASMLDRLVAATLYEGYILYPYRPSSVKNQVRWTFGGVHPRAWSEASGGTDPWLVRTECLLRSRDDAVVSVHARFLQLVTRTVARLDPPSVSLDDDVLPQLEEVEELQVA